MERQRAIDLQENLLKHVRGIVRRTYYPQNESEHFSVVAAHQGIEGRMIAALGKTDQCAFVNCP